MAQAVVFPRRLRVSRSRLDPIRWHAYSLSLAPRSVVRHYFDVSISKLLSLRYCADSSPQETIEAQSEYGGDAESAFSAYSAADLNTLGDISPDAL